MNNVAIDRLSVVIVNYRTPGLVLKCVDSVLHWSIADAGDIIVVENASPDDSQIRLQKELPEGVRLVIADKNGGYSSGVNLGAQHAKQNILLVLNPDTYFIDTSISKVLNLFSDNPTAGLIGLELTYPNGERQFSARRFYSILDIVCRRSALGRRWPLKLIVEKHLMLKEWSKGGPFDTDWVMGTGFLIRRALFEKIGKMDEDFFLYMEDVDLCARVWRAGFRVVCAPGALLVHDHQRSSSAGPLSGAGKMHLRSLNIFRKKYRIPLFSPPGVEGIFRR